MLFAEEMNSYYGGPQHSNPSNSASTPLEMTTAPWKPSGHSGPDHASTGFGYNVAHHNISKGI